jgi:hypothetical protein
MAQSTLDTFDPLHSYISVRLLQGVPLVDADWNEAHDVRKFEVQAFLKWFVGNGVPKGNDGFRIASLTSVRLGDDNPPVYVWDFVIKRGVDEAPAGTSPVEQGLRHVGRCLVDGMDVLIAEDRRFRAQPLHVSQGGSAAQARLLGVPTIAEIPVSDDPVVVYLDVWERLVTPDEEPGLKHIGLGVESCARLKREWVVRVRAGSSVPTPNDPNHPGDFIVGHSYYALATITHKRNIPFIDEAITDEAITDLRERRLLLPPATLLEDLLGPVDYLDYRRGQGRPGVSLREAINALLRGELPCSPEAPIDPEPGFIGLPLSGTFFDAANGLITTWTRYQPGATQAFLARLSPTRPEAGFRKILELAGVSSDLHAALLDTGELLIVYNTPTEGGERTRIVLKRGTPKTLPDSPAITVTDTAESGLEPFAVAVSGQVLILWRQFEGTGNTVRPRPWRFKWYSVANGSFSEAHNLADIEVPESRLHAAMDSTNTVWVAFSDMYVNTNHPINVIAVPPDGLPGQPQTFRSLSGFDNDPFVMVDNSDNVWVFWNSQVPAIPNATERISRSIWYRRYLRARGEWEDSASVAGVSFEVVTDLPIWFWSSPPVAVSDAEGDVWVFWVKFASNNAANIWYTRYSLAMQSWGEPRPITHYPATEVTPFVLRGLDGALWLFWRRRDIANPYSSQLFYRRIFPSI